MIFTTPQFVIFILLFFWVWCLLARRGRKWFVLLASYVFYASWSPAFLALIILSTAVDFVVGQRLFTAQYEPRRRRLLWTSVGVNLGTLGLFKYFNFFIDSATALIGSLGFEMSSTTLEIILPIGISFYTFQTMSYTIDIYRRRLQPTKSLLDFSIFVAFFPQLVAGPIERARRLLPQIENLNQLRTDSTGFGLIAVGCFKKVVIADNLAQIVDTVYAQPELASTPALWLATYAFAVQIYCDFSGYSDIAVGLARLMGIQLVQNFDAPYAACGPTEFWRRWHISLSTWLRDYLYIGLGGNRRGGLLTYRNLMLTMLLGGLWHGAAWNFVLWGAWHGALLMVCRPTAVRKLGERLESHVPSRWVTRMIRRIVFFHLVCLGWALFRAHSLADCQTMMVGLLSLADMELNQWLSAVKASGQSGWLMIAAMMSAGVILTQFLLPTNSKTIVQRLWRTPEPIRFAFVVCTLYLCALCAPEQAPPFLYFQF